MSGKRKGVYIALTVVLTAVFLLYQDKHTPNTHLYSQNILCILKRGDFRIKTVGKKFSLRKIYEAQNFDLKCVEEHG